LGDTVGDESRVLQFLGCGSVEQMNLQTVTENSTRVLKQLDVEGVSGPQERSPQKGLCLE